MYILVLKNLSILLEYNFEMIYIIHILWQQQQSQNKYS